MLRTTSIKKENVQSPGWMVPFILIAIFVVYLPALRAGFVNWDDGDYVVDNPLIKDFSHLKELLTTPMQGNHHPLTMLSFALNYAISGLNAWSYHLVNLLLHLINSILVFRLAMLLSGRNTIIAFTTALLFGIHPMHVESVAWVPERKDVLYGLSFLAGLITYTKYTDTGSRRQYTLAIIFLVLSLLAKSAAVIFPVVLFCIDILKRRKFNFALLLEKTPFFLLSLMGGVISLITQTEAGSTGALFFRPITRILMGFYGIMMYFFKMIVPVNLSTFYPYPATNKSLPVEYYLSPLFFIALMVLVYYSLKRNRVIAFGILFYLVNLLLVLQFIPAGSAVIADRYTYIPYIGLFFTTGWFINRYAKENISKAFYIIIPLGLVFSVLTYRQSSIWISSETLWDHTIQSHPSVRAYRKRAFLFWEEKNYEKAVEYYSRVFEISPYEYRTYTNRGEVYLEQNKPGLAYGDFTKALSIKPGYYFAMDGLGGLFTRREQNDSALKYLNMALAERPGYLPSLKSRGLINKKLNRYPEAVRDFESTGN